MSSESGIELSKECIDLFLQSMEEDQVHHHVFVVFGASGDLARKKIYPTLWWLYRDNLLPQKIHFVGYARTAMTIQELSAKCSPYMKISDNCKQKSEDFWKLNSYMSGAYDMDEGFQKMNSYIHENFGSYVNKIFYLALPPSVFKPVTEKIALHCSSKKNDSFSRVIIEKPFGHDLQSSNALSEHLCKLYDEKSLYRIDHYLGKEMVQNLIILRFANRLFLPLWCHEHISCVTISFKEPFGTQGRGGYFDSSGIIRDIIQNHLMQILSLIAMEKPLSKDAADIRSEKIKVLRSIKTPELSDVVLGQYIGDKNASADTDAFLGYLEDPTVPNDSSTETYACIRLSINNDRWKGVPFILRAGKVHLCVALNERKAEVRVQFKDVPVDIFDEGGKSMQRNELVIRVQPDEAVYVKFMTKQPGMSFKPEETELDLTYSKRYQGIHLPDAYERLILDVFCGNQTNFVHSDELREAWRIFSPILDKMKKKQIAPLPYMYGSRNGPEEADKLMYNSGFKYTGTYKWKTGSA
ncbi:glucose-6-phosphate 1-dehydrogenase [Cichlidogyrus casuarinus]|uniref:Glucose-6-phosphate 1-dehydrogenase n=1 Tax=Cichlidogyrus casuarinus TaxID=1844966 RepID=A0ABD2Q5I9_9PLAT